MRRYSQAVEFPDLPEATVARLPEYLRALHNLAEAGHDTVSSEDLARMAGVSSAKLRKDLSQLGSYGTRGVGYEVTVLIGQIEQILGLTTHRNVALVGIGNLGHALAGYAGFASRGFRVRALVDVDPATVGKTLRGIVVSHLDDLPETVAREQIAIGVITTPAAAAQAVADRLVAAGVTSILNFAPCVLTVPEGVDVRKVDLAIELQILSFHEHRKSAQLRRGSVAGAVRSALVRGRRSRGPDRAGGDGSGAGPARGSADGSGPARAPAGGTVSATAPDGEVSAKRPVRKAVDP